MREGTMRTTTRADEVRQRRNERTQQKVGRVSKRTSYAAEMPVIITRGGVGVPVIKRATRQPRRKWIIPLGTPGAEIHMPSIPAIRPGWRLFSGFIAICMGGMIYILLNAPFMKIGHLTVMGNQRLPAADIEAVSGAAGVPFVKFDPAFTRQEIGEAFPELKTIDVKFEIPAGAVIHVTERQPIIEWQNGDERKWIDEHGVIFAPRGEAGSLLVVQSNITPPLELSVIPAEELEDLVETTDGAGEIAKERLDTELFHTIQHLSSITPQGTVLIYNSEKGLGWVDPEGWQVYLGLWLGNLETKVEVYEAIVDYLSKQGIRPAVISVAQVNAPFYRMEQ